MIIHPLMHTECTCLYTHSNKDQQGQLWTTGQQKQTNKDDNKEVMWEPIKVQAGLKCVLYDLWNTALQGQLAAYMAGPDKSRWSNMFVSDRGWVHKGTRHTSSSYQLLKHGQVYCFCHTAAAKAYFTKLTWPYFLYVTVPWAWEMS